MSSGIDIFVPDHSRGLMIDAMVLRSALKGVQLRIISVPNACYSSPQQESEAAIALEPGGKVALFIESVFEHRDLFAYDRRILLPNPEWLLQEDMERVSRTITEFWHKTRFGLEQISPLFPSGRHVFTGFTSPALPRAEQDFSIFGHFAGRGQRWRHTQALIDLWLARPQFPQLTLHAYDAEALNVPVWLQHGNLRIRTGYLDDLEYFAEFAGKGIQLCTSQMEGFGHYINEARSLGALIITIDAPPMNELISSDCGILVPAERSRRRGCGLRSSASREALEQAVQEALYMPIAVRRNVGRIACERYLTEQDTFLETIRCIL